MSNFIPGLHFVSAEDKLKPEWCQKAKNYYWDNTANFSLLQDKHIEEIDNFVSAKFSLDPFKKMYKSQEIEMQKKSNPNYLSSNSNSSGMEWQRISLITDKYNSATSLIQKIPVEVTVKALDSLAAKKKEEDLNFIKNKPVIEKDLQAIADKLQLGKVDLGTTTHSSVPFSSDPYGLDLNEPDELNVFVSLLYSLKVEAAFETILDIFWKLKRGNQIKLLVIRDQFKYGVSAVDAYQSSLTGMPDASRVYPGNVYVPKSDLPDYSDRTCEFIYEQPTAIELFNLFGSEICDMTKLDEIINGTGSGTGYCECNNQSKVHINSFSTFRVQLIKCRIITVDAIGITGNPKSKKSYTYFTTDPEEIKTCKEKVYAQNTICFYWLNNTKHFFGIHKLGSATRKKGAETFQTFPMTINRSQEKSAVELSIGENKIAQEAHIKMQHAIRKSLPAGSVVDLRFIRNALSGLTDENNGYTMERLITLAFEENQVIIDTEGFEGKNDGQFRPFVPIPGGLNMNEVAGYAQVIMNCEKNVNKYMGTNDQITGQAYQELVGNNKLAQNASMNAISYVSDAVQFHVQGVYNIWSYGIKQSVEDGGDSKKAIKNIIGSEQVNLIDAIDDFTSHQMSVEIKVSQREEERLKLEQSMYILKQKGVISEADEYMLSAVHNPKAKWALIAVKEKLFFKREAKKQQEMFAHQQMLAKQQGDNIMQAQQAENQGDIQKIYAKGDVESSLLQLANNFNVSVLQMEGIIKKGLQEERSQGQINKNISSLREKFNLEQQQPVVA